LIKQQRPIAELPEQALLQDKLNLSRIRYFVSIIFSRPATRDMSRFERALLTVMWPMAAGLLALASIEVFQAWQGHEKGFKPDRFSVANSTRIDVAGQEGHPATFWPQVSEYEG
jgi:hypothetical protein